MKGTTGYTLATLLCALVMATIGCGRGAVGKPGPARSLVLVTIDTLRADRIGAYGYPAARTPVMDGIAARGARFDRAYATAPITLTSHGSLMTGRYPPAHGGRHNGMQVGASAATLAEALEAAGFATGAFVGAFPLDRRFGLARGFQAYGDRMPRDADGRLSNERPGAAVVDEALAWLGGRHGSRFFLWVHLFEPHAPYGNPADRRPVEARYDDEVAEADRQVGRIVSALGADQASTLLVVASDHGEAFGEHGEIGHSIFVYDTTLRVPLLVSGPGIAPRAIADPVALVDLPSTVAPLLGLQPFRGDGVDLGPLLLGRTLAARELYAESFAPLLDFGWSPLRSMRDGRFKYIAAPRPELYDTREDPGETTNVAAGSPQEARRLDGLAAKISPATLDRASPVDADAARRLQSLGYASGRPRDEESGRADPKDRRDLAARLAQVTSGELTGTALESTLRAILAEDAQNPQAHLRLGYLLADSSRCREAEPHFRAAIAARMPTADAHLGLAGCFADAREFDKAAATLGDAIAVEPGNPVVIANQGVILSEAGRPKAAIPVLQRALALDPDFHEARFNLAIAFARAGDRGPAAEQAGELLRRLPADAPQRAEVERLLATLAPDASRR